MLKRTVTGFVMLLIAIPVCVYSDTVVFPAVIALLSVIGAGEMLKCIGTLGKKALSVPLLAASLAIPLGAYFIGGSALFLALYAGLTAVLMVYILSLPVFTAGRTDVGSVCTSFVGTFYISTAFASIILLRYGENGIYYFLIPIIAPMICDIFAYLCGRLFGKHKLIPKVSPNKTVEGSVGGTLFCTAACTGYGAVLYSFSVGGMLPIWAFAVGGVVIAVVSQVGDLIASAVKRNFGVKDYGKIFPGHGGVMDRFDSVIATAPLFLIFTVVLKCLGI